MSSFLSQLRRRGLVHDISNFEALDALLAKDKIAFYCGFDPTASSLHVGSMLPLLVMQRFQRAGHTPLVILGSGTGMIGDPSGKSEERKLLSDEDLAVNLAGIQQQIGVFLSDKGTNAFQILKNDSWLRELSCIEYLRDVGKHFSVNAMMVKDSVKTRLTDREQGISYTEFSYMLLQSYDFYWLFKNRNCLLQIGGSDQWGNITAGIDFIRRKMQSGTSPVHGLTIPLITTASGTKFGKTEQGNIWLDPKRTSPYRFYQYWLNTQDADVVRFLNYFTDLTDEQIQGLADALSARPEERVAQLRLAQILTDLVHGQAETAKAKRASAALFGGAISDLSKDELLEIFSEVPSSSLPSAEFGAGMNVTELLSRGAVVPSKGEARRLIEGGGVYLNNERVSDASLVVTAQSLLDGGLLVIRVGKKKYHLLQIR